MNLGRPAGAGVVDHLHVHVVPRWSGDTNFMSVVGSVRVLPEDLHATAARLKPVFERLGQVTTRLRRRAGLASPTLAPRPPGTRAFDLPTDRGDDPSCSRRTGPSTAPSTCDAVTSSTPSSFSTLRRTAFSHPPQVMPVTDRRHVLSHRSLLKEGNGIITPGLTASWLRSLTGTSASRH